MDKLIIVLSLILLVITLILKLLINKLSKKGTEIVEFYPPENMNPVQLGYFLDGQVNTHDIIGLIIYMESKGYIKREHIEEDGESIILLNKIKNPPLKKEDGSVYYLFYELFLKGKTKVRLNDFDIHKVTNYMNKKLATIYQKKPIFNSKQKVLKSILVFILISLFIAPLVMSGLDWLIFLLKEHEFGIFLIFLTIFLGFLYFNNGFGTIIYRNCDILFQKQSTFAMRLLIYIYMLVTIGMDSFFYYYYFYIILDENLNLYNFNIFVAMLLPWVLAFGFCLVHMISLITISSIKWRNKEHQQLLGRVKGFKQFIELAEKDRIDQLIAEDPQYFYKVIPYAYIFGVSNQWIKQAHSEINEDFIEDIIWKQIITIPGSMELTDKLEACIDIKDMIMMIIESIKTIPSKLRKKDN